MMCAELSSILALTEARKGGFGGEGFWNIAAIMEFCVMNLRARSGQESVFHFDWSIRGQSMI